MGFNSGFKGLKESIAHDRSWTQSACH